MKRLTIYFSALILGLLLVIPFQNVQADVNDFVINDFYGKYELLSDKPGGRLITTERIRLTFSDQNHGILRALPKSNRDRLLHIKVLEIIRDGQAEQYTTYDDSNDNLVLKIGKPDLTITGGHEYIIKYESRGGIVNSFETYDEWYWDVNGTGWSQPFEKVAGEVVLPAAARSRLQAACYAGTAGSTDKSDCRITPTPTGYTFAATRQFGPSENLTVAVALPKGIFPDYTSVDRIKDHPLLVLGLLSIIPSFYIAYRTWRRYGDDPEGKGTIIPEYDPPAGLSPAEVGLVYDYSVQSSDISATIVDLAIRGYVVIRDETKKYLGFIKVRNFSFVLKNSDFSKLKNHESKLLEAIFEGAPAGTEKSVNSLSKTRMVAAVNSLSKGLEDELSAEGGVFDKRSRKLEGLFILIGVALIIVSFLLINAEGFNPGLLVSGMLFFGFGVAMRRRTPLGVAAYDHVKGLFVYIATAEADRMKMMQSVDRPYNPPKKDYDFFEKLLPFAIALGLEQTWAKQFADAFDTSPDWYQSSTGFSGGFNATNLASGIDGMSQSFASQSSSSSSGSGGGGSSGGGGGGGGGGGW